MAPDSNVPGRVDRLLGSAAIVLLLFSGLADSASAGEARQSGTAGLRVILSSGDELDGRPVNVSVSESRGGGRSRRARLDPSGVASLAGLPPGVYEVVVERAGGPTLSTSTDLGPQQIVTIAAFLDAGPDSRLDVIDRHRAAEGAAFDERMLRALPGDDDLWAIIETTVPFVVADRMDTGGLGLARSAMVGSRGASWLSTSVKLGDLVIEDPGRSGLLAIAPDTGALEAMDDSSGLAPAEIATPGVAISLLPRRPGPTFGGEVRASATPGGFVATNALPQAPSIARIDTWRRAGISAGGPTGRRGGIFAAASYSRAGYLERDDPAPLSARSATGFGHVVVNPTERDQVRAIASVERLRYPYAGRRQFADIGLSERATLWQAQLGWERLSAGGGRSAVGLAVHRSERTPGIGESPEGGAIDRLFDGALPAPAAAIESSEIQVRGEWQPRDFRAAGVRHSVRVGGTLRRVTRRSQLLAQPTVAELVANLPARVWLYQAASVSSRRSLSDAALFVTDRLTMAPRLTVEAGVRVQSATGSANGADVGLSWRTASPRLSFRWSPAMLSVFGGYGWYAARHALSLLAYGDPGEPWASVYRWSDESGDGVYQPDEQGVLVSRAGWGQRVASIDPDLKAPRTREFTIGGELRHGTRHTFQGVIVIRHQTDLVGSTNVGVPRSSYRSFEIIDGNADYDSPTDDRPLTVYDRLPESFGQDQYVLTNPAQSTATYEGIELTWRFRSARWRMTFGATAYRTRGRGGQRGFHVLENDPLVVGEVYEQPNAAPVDVGSFFFDRSYVGKWSGSYHAPGDVRIAFAARYQDGQPFSRMVIVPDLSTGPEMITAYRVGLTRFTYTFTLDVRLEKGVRIAGRRAAFRLDVFNLTNHRNEVEEYVVGGPAYRQSTAVQPPLTVRLGFRFEF